MRLVLGIFSSHRGSTLRAVAEACRTRLAESQIAIVLTNNNESGAMAVARENRIPCAYVSAKTHVDGAKRDAATLAILLEHNVNLVLLLGYMKKIGPAILNAYAGRILNTHPSLLPNYGGRGMYGIRVQEAVLANAETETGATIHLVDEEYDQGPIVLQSRLPITSGDTPLTLQSKVQAVEMVDSAIHNVFLE